MSKAVLIVRSVLGLMFFVFGLMGLLNLMPPPPDLPENLKLFNQGMMATGYFFPLVKGTETICGLMLLTGQFVPLALVVLAPVALNIFLVHLFMQPEGLPIALIIGIMLVYLSFFASPYKATIKGLFQRK